MVAGLIIVAVWSSVLLFLSLMITGVFGVGRLYPFTLPFIIAACLCIVLAITGIRLKKARGALFWTTTLLHGSLLFLFRFALMRWPGGDDGPGLAWGILVGGGSCIAVFLAILVIILGMVDILGKRIDRQHHFRAG